MSDKHTPGPWKQHPDYPWIVKEDNAPISEDGVSICNTTGHPNSGFFPTPSEALANARLIAAAPELLEALQNIIESVDKGHAVILCPLAAAARSAIAKAKGEKP